MTTFQLSKGERAEIRFVSIKAPPPGQKSFFFPEHSILVKFLLNMYLTLDSPSVKKFSFIILNFYESLSSY